MNRRTALSLIAGAAYAAPRSRVLPESARVTIRAEEDWYMHSAGVAVSGNEIVCTYRRSDEHIASYVEVWCCRSKDGGRSWTDHKLITKLGWEPDRACWVAPQLNRLADGTLALIIDRGEKTAKYDWPMLSQWQKPPRGMSNWLMLSKDGGRTWDGPRKIDDVGGEPGYIVELSNGDLVYTRTDSAATTAKKYPSMPWGPNYYRSTAVFSSNRGRTWDRTVAITDDPLVGDCEVGLVEYAPGKVLAATRIGDAGSALAQPSRFVMSGDLGRTWQKPVLAPFYGHRIYVRKLRDGRLFATFRNASGGTPATCALAWNADEKLPYQPQSFLWTEAVCSLRNGAMELKTGEGREQAAQFLLYPMEDDDSSLELEFELRVPEAAANACNVCAGAWIRFLPNRIELADRPSDGVNLDASKWRRYRIVNQQGRLRLWCDGEQRLDVAVNGVFTREVRFGNRSGRRSTAVAGTANNDQNTRRPLRGITYEANAGISQWRSFRASIRNRRDHSVEWNWTAKQGFPDQFRRDRIVVLEPNASFVAGDSGYSSWDELPDGSVVAVDYTGGVEGRRHPLLRAYRFRP
ncbi:MAG: exo-alpha-sialidase [Bryobacterales bacterium]|nr:exo-alpha-sialidase [Bryobacterales bacterium]